MSEDGGETFHRYSAGPIMDRSIHDACFVSSMCVAPHGDGYGMWYNPASIGAPPPRACSINTI
jgi:hypothetical protein